MLTYKELIELVKYTRNPASFTKYYVYDTSGAFIDMSPLKQNAIARAKAEKEKHRHRDYVVIKMPPKKP